MIAIEADRSAKAVCTSIKLLSKSSQEISSLIYQSEDTGLSKLAEGFIILCSASAIR